LRIYVETNFLLEMVFEQEQRDACESILALAEGNAAVTLAIPAVCFTEPPGRLHSILRSAALHYARSP
jgi:hypothetical protein